MVEFTQDDITRATGRQINKAMSSRHEWRFGSKGAFSVNPGKAVWFDHETGQGGTVSALLGRTVSDSAPSRGHGRPARHRKRWSREAMRLWSGAK